jgi:hypothetical protein
LSYPHFQNFEIVLLRAKMAGMEKHDRDFKGVWIPKEIWLSENLSLMEKVLFVEIHSLDNERGCFASNRYFANFFQVSPRQIATYVASLREKGFVTTTVRNLNERVIRTAGRFRRIPNSEMQAFKQGRADLVKKMKIQ